MSVQRPNLWRVISDTSHIIRSNSLHFLALSLVFIFPVSLLSVIYALLLQPSPSPSPLINSHYRRLLSTVSSADPVSQIPSLDKTLILPQFLYGLILITFNLCATSSVTHGIFHGFHSKTPKLSASLKSIISSFLPLLATKLVYLVIVVAVCFGFGICMGFLFLGLMLLGLEIEATSKPVIAVAGVTMILLLAVLVYLTVKWLLIEAVVVVESKYGFAPLERSSSLMKGAWSVGFLMIVLFSIPHVMLSAWFSAVARGGCSVAVALQLLAYAAFSTALSLFVLAAKTVLFVHLNGQILGFESDGNKLGQVYVQLPVDQV